MTTQNFQVSDFVEYTTNTREMRRKNPADFIDLAERRTLIVPEFLAMPEADMIDGGEPMIWKVHARQSNNKGGYITFGQFRTVGRTTGTGTCSVLHRQLENNEAWLEPEADYNNGDPDAHWLKLEDLIWNALDGNHLELLEDALLLPPDPNMESASKGKFPHISIPAFVCPGAAGASVGTVPSNYTSASVATQMGLDQSTFTAWRNQFREYSKANPFNVSDGLIGTMKKFLRRLTWEAKIKAYAKRAKWQPSAKSSMMIITGENGADLYEDALDYRNDKTFAADDPKVPTPKIRGLEVIGVQRIDELNLKHNSATAYTAPYGANEPPFWFIDTDHLKLKFHPKYRLKETVRVGDLNQWDKNAVFRTSSFNLWSDARNRLGVMTAA